LQKRQAQREDVLFEGVVERGGVGGGLEEKGEEQGRAVNE